MTVRNKIRMPDSNIGLGEAGLTAFESSLKALDRGTTNVPMGWRSAYQRCLQHLSQMSCRKRADLRLAGPVVANGDIAVAASRSDRSVEGVLRKLSMQVRCHCELCGRNARLRSIGLRSRAMCAECFAPVALQDDISGLLDRLRDGPDSLPVLFACDLPQRVLACIPESIWRQNQSTPGHDSKYLARQDLQDWLSKLVAATSRGRGDA